MQGITSMATVVALIDDYQAFWREVVEADFNEYIAKIDDLRRAFHSAISLFHLHDWIYVAHKANVDANFKFKNKNGTLQPVHDENSFAKAIGDMHPDFELIRQIANSAKHLKLRSAGSHPSAPSHAANTRVQATGWGEGEYGKGPYGGTPRVMLEGPNGHDLEFSDLVRSTHEMWKSLSQKHYWKLET
jgi:hypothetical protein